MSGLACTTRALKGSGTNSAGRTASNNGMRFVSVVGLDDSDIVWPSIDEMDTANGVSDAAASASHCHIKLNQCPPPPQHDNCGGTAAYHASLLKHFSQQCPKALKVWYREL